MNKINIVEFYCEGGKNIEGRSLRQMLSMSDQELERSHTIIQWMFPLNEISMHNFAAPILNDEDIKELIAHQMFKETFDKVAVRFLNFLKEGGLEHPSWVRYKNHNYLRITRAIKCSLLLEQEPWADKFYSFAMDIYNKFPEIIGSTTMEFWQKAAANVC